VHIDAPQEFQYAAAHRNSPGKYFLELPVYLWPWTLLVIAAARRAWLARHAARDEMRPVRFALASALPPLLLLSVAATARNIYLAPALPGFALLLGWWYREIQKERDAWDRRAISATAALLLLAAAAFAAALVITDTGSGRAAAVLAFLGLIVSGGLALRAGLAALLLSYCTLLAVPAAVLYGRVDAWQDLASIGRAIGDDSAGRPLVLMTPDETTRAMIDMYARREVELVRAPMDTTSVTQLKQKLAGEPRALVVVQLSGREMTDTYRRIAASFGITTASLEQAPQWAPEVGLGVAHRYSLPNGRRYALLAPIR
jgi:hypothetical protein